MGVFSEKENLWNGGQFESDFKAWEYIIVGSGLPGNLIINKFKKKFLNLFFNDFVHSYPR